MYSGYLGRKYNNSVQSFHTPLEGLSGGATTSENHLAAFPEAEHSHVSFAAILPLVDTPQGCAGVYTKRHAHIHVCVT